MNSLKETCASDSYQNIEGWLGDGEVNLLGLFNEMQTTRGITGDVCEIGVHHGRLFILLYLCCRESERAIAIDVFGHQEFNLDQSGGGSLGTFLKNLRANVGNADRLILMERDSLTVRPHEFSRAIRLFSVDGCHLAIHTAHDLALAEQTITPGGIILMDDFFNPYWPGVSEGVNRFYSLHAAPSIAPLAICGNKVALTTIGHHAMYLAELKASKALRVQKETVMFGFPVLRV
jgi:hypothetical protein